MEVGFCRGPGFPTYYPKRRKPSTSGSSMSGMPQGSEEIIVWTRSPDDFSNWDYQLRDIGGIKIGSYDANGKRVAGNEAIMELIGKATDLDLDQDFGIVSEEVCKCFERLPSLFISTKMVPDVMLVRKVKNDEVPIICIEMHSSPYHRSLYKLGTVLMEQLRFLRNCNNSIKEWTGFVFPKLDEPSSVCKVTITWDDECLRFFLTYDAVGQDDVTNKIRDAFQRQKGQVSELPEGEMTGLPMSEDWLSHFADQMENLSSSSVVVVTGTKEKPSKLTVGDKPIQELSRSSVVVGTGKFVYKWGIKKHDMLYTSTAQFTGDRYRNGTVQFLFPLETVICSTRCFLKFRELNPPLDREHFNANLKYHSRSISSAICSLHTEVNIAHLDIRLENICWTNSNVAVLIDLERCAAKSTPAKAFRHCYDSVMYQVDDNWTAEMVDWYQFGLVLIYCLRPCPYYHEMQIIQEDKKNVVIGVLLQGRPPESFDGLTSEAEH